MMKAISSLLVIALCVNAAFVVKKLLAKENAWRLIVVYWIILTIKNSVDTLALVL